MTRSIFVRLITCAVLALALLGLASCGDDDGHTGDHSSGMSGMTAGSAPAGSIAVDLVNWAVVPAQSSVKAGEVKFYAVHSMDHMHSANEGGNTHELAVARRTADGSWEVVGRAQDIAMGQAKELVLTLTPGEYELQCNVVEQVGGKIISHYKEGMHTGFTVTA